MPSRKVECWQCGDMTKKQESNIRNSKRDFCSNRCKHAYFRENGAEVFGEQISLKERMEG